MFLPFRLSACACLYLMRSIIMTDLFLPLSTVSGCVIPFYGLHHHGWHVPAILDHQQVRIYISRWAKSWLTCSCHFLLSAGAYSHLMKCIITAYMFLPFSTIRKWVFIFQEQHNHGWHVPATFWFSGCVIEVHALHHHGLHVLAVFDYQEVRIYILWAA